MLHTPLQVINDLDELSIYTDVVDVMFIFSAYSRQNLRDWVDSFGPVLRIPGKQKLVIAEVEQLILISQ